MKIPRFRIRALQQGDHDWTFEVYIVDGEGDARWLDAFQTSSEAEEFVDKIRKQPIEAVMSSLDSLDDIKWTKR